MKERAFAPVVALIGSVALAACGATAKAMVHPIGAAGQANASTSSYTGISRVSPNLHAVVGSMMVCSDSSRVTRILSATPVGETGKITVVSVRTRPNPFAAHPQLDAIGAARGSLARMWPKSSDNVVRCASSASDTGSEIALEMSIATRTNAAARGWTFTVTDGQSTSSFYYPFGVILCSTPSPNSAPCAALSRAYTGTHY